MNDKKILYVSIGLLSIALVLFVMSLRNNAVRTESNDGQSNVNENITEPPVPTPGPNPGQMQTPNPTPTPASFTPAGEIAIKGWWLNKVVLDGKEVSLDVNVPSALTLNFAADKRYSGFAGCNDYSGSFVSDNSGAFDFGAIISTKKYCMGGSELEAKVFQAMEKIEVYGFDGKKNLILESKDKKTRLEYVPAV